MNRSEIKSVQVVQLSPVQNAVKSLVERIEELSSVEHLIKQNLREGIDPETIAGSAAFGSLSRLLAGTVDSPVNGGVGQYRIFFTMNQPQDPLGRQEENFELNVSYLRRAFNSLIRLLNELLKLHDVLVPTNLQTQHRIMVKLFKKNFRSEISDLRLDVDSTWDLEGLMESLISTNVYSRRYQERMAEEMEMEMELQMQRDVVEFDESEFGFESSLGGYDNDFMLESGGRSNSVSGTVLSSGSGSEALSRGRSGMDNREMAPIIIGAPPLGGGIYPPYGGSTSSVTTPVSPTFSSVTPTTPTFAAPVAVVPLATIPGTPYDTREGFIGGVIDDSMTSLVDDDAHEIASNTTTSTNSAHSQQYPLASDRLGGAPNFGNGQGSPSSAAATVGGGGGAIYSAAGHQSHSSTNVGSSSKKNRFSTGWSKRTILNSRH
ncbi:unnamed protein product [Ambrosiozyma monospora]|uniref:Unnamed protein product n=1 Tax=Ambrosiozyma monospora TaxID=43982 RepID=A0A9W6Z793_AMBMO|nr:unnamed protein product [Ambrosiozyma monospora]